MFIENVGAGYSLLATYWIKVNEHWDDSRVKSAHLKKIKKTSSGKLQKAISTVDFLFEEQPKLIQKKKLPPIPSNKIVIYSQPRAKIKLTRQEIVQRRLEDLDKLLECKFPVSLINARSMLHTCLY